MLEAVATIIAVLVALSLVLSAWLDRSRANRYLQLVHTERTRSVWAEAREELFNLVRDGKLDPRSRTFDVLFGIQTFIVRRPDAYQAIAGQLQDSLIARENLGVPSWIEEKQTWPEEMTGILVKMAKGSEMLAFGYPGLFGKLLRLTAAQAPGKMANTVRSVVERLLSLFSHQDDLRVEQDLFRARDQLTRLSGRSGSGGYDLRLA